ncbi:polyphosphate--nucleotide phosphotransferase [Aerococcaceae bacterium DSM 111021]|nr:polyphosphate--nucleotide phosphotransferase [Aerococcaceae bacterium DSM 111021]
MDFKDFKVTNQSFNLSDFKESYLSDKEDKYFRDKVYDDDVQEMQEWHKKLNAEGKQGVLVVLQALDAAGKDELIQYIFSTLLPQGIKVTSIKQPTKTEQQHDYLWRIRDGLPARGELAILNRSYYENIIAPQIHDSLEDSLLPNVVKKDEDLIQKRYKHINGFEEYLFENGFPVIKLFFHMSKEKQRQRFLERIENPDMQHEFSFSDIDDRKKWVEYQDVFQDMLKHTATEAAPWYILPADNPWLSRHIVTQAIIATLKQMNPEYPTFSQDEQEKAEKIKRQLKNEEL